MSNNFFFMSSESQFTIQFEQNMIDNQQIGEKGIFLFFSLCFLIKKKEGV